MAFRGLVRLLRRKESTVPGKIPIDLIANYLPAAPVTVDAGAHVGVDTVEIARKWPKGHIHAFEPVPAIFKQLETNTRRLQNVRRYPLALGRKNGKARIFVSGGGSDGSSSLLPPKEHLSLHPEVTFGEDIEIRTVSLDSWAKQEGIERVDFLWLDLQGYELEALKGAKRLLPTVRVIHTEVNLVEVYAGAPLYPEYRAWLETQGFQVAREAIDWEDGGNVLFVRR